jgi:P pilus assembly chaperone PapD
MKKFCELQLLFLCGLLLLSLQRSAAEFTFSPINLIVEAPSGRGESNIYLYNPTNKAVRLQLSLSEWEVSNTNEILINERNDRDGVGEYIKLSPQQFTLAPKEQKIVRIACDLPEKLPNKEYKLFLNMLEIGSERRITESSEKVKAGIVVNKLVSIGTYLHKGDPTAFRSDLNIKTLGAKTEQQQLVYTLTYENTGNMHARVGLVLKFYDAQNILLAERKVSGLLALPTAGKGSITYSDQYELTGGLAQGTARQVEFIFTDLNNPANKTIIKRVNL